MTYVVTENCIKCKYMDCVEVCPVDCFYVGENMLVIHPDECIDCGVCEPECPAEAIVPDSDDKAAAWVEQNRTYAASVAQHHPQGRAAGGRRRRGRTSRARRSCSPPNPARPDPRRPLTRTLGPRTGLAGRAGLLHGRACCDEAKGGVAQPRPSSAAAPTG